MEFTQHEADSQQIMYNANTQTAATQFVTVQPPLLASAPSPSPTLKDMKIIAFARSLTPWRIEHGILGFST